MIAFSLTLKGFEYRPTNPSKREICQCTYGNLRRDQLGHQFNHVFNNLGHSGNYPHFWKDKKAYSPNLYRRRRRPNPSFLSNHLLKCHNINLEPKEKCRGSYKSVQDHAKK